MSSLLTECVLELPRYTRTKKISKPFDGKKKEKNTIVSNKVEMKILNSTFKPCGTSGTELRD